MQQIKYKIVSAYDKQTHEQAVNDLLQEGWNTVGGVSVAIEVTDRKALYFYTQAMTLITGTPMITYAITDESVTKDSEEKT
jgi:hypothetical protein